MDSCRVARWLPCALLVGFLLLTGCERGGTSDNVPAAATPVRNAPPIQRSPADQGRPDREPPADAPAAHLTPREIVQQLHEHRTHGRYRQMIALLVAERRSAVHELVLAVDALVAAEFGLQEAIRRAIGEGSALRFSQRQQVANIIGVLSRDVEVIGEQVAGDSATVTIQVAGRVPLEAVPLERRDGVWQVQTDEPVDGLAAALGELAAVTRRMSGEVARRDYSADQIERELALRQTPVLRRIAVLLSPEPEEENP